MNQKTKNIQYGITNIESIIKENHYFVDKTGFIEPFQRILVFQQHGSGENKIKGIREYGKKGLFELKTVDIDSPLPILIEEPEQYINRDIKADIVLDYLKHPDLSIALADICAEKGIKVIASGKKIKGALIPPTCCGLKETQGLGYYGQDFGAPKFLAKVSKDNIIEELKVIRGAPCGATWKAAESVLGLPTDKAEITIGLQTQFFCTANPAGWDPIYGKSPVHFAGNIHSKALQKAVLNSQKIGK